MTNETPPQETIELKPIPFGARLKAAREAMGLERKEVAIQLRLPEKIILMMEKERYAADLPATFIRGYVRAYGKFLQLPDYEINQAIEPIKPKPLTTNIIPFSSRSLVPVTSKHYFMQIFSYLIAFTLLGLLGVWWYNHSNSNPSLFLETAGTMIENITNTKKAEIAENAATSNHSSALELNKVPNQIVANNHSSKKTTHNNDPYLDDLDTNE